MAINGALYVPGRIASLGTFDEEGVTTTTVEIEKDGEMLAQVESTPRVAKVKSCWARSAR